MLTKKKGWQKWEVCLRERESVWVFFYVGVEKATWQAKINGKKRINHIKGIERGGKSDNTKHMCIYSWFSSSLAAVVIGYFSK